MRDGYELRRFGPEEAAVLADGELVPSERMKAWSRATARGFNSPPPTEEETLRQTVTCLEGDGLMLEVFPRATSPDPKVAKEPVGTFTSFDGMVNLGRESLVEAAMFSEVTVQPAHKRRGIFREMITTSLKRAKEAGVPVALLTASSGALYGRFGFTVVSSYAAARLSPQPTSRFRPEVLERLQGLGRVEAVRLSWLAQRANDIYDGFLVRHRCATTRSSVYLEDLYYLPNAPVPSPRYRAIVHLNPAGEPDGYAIYSVHKETIMRVEEVVTGDPHVELALWDYLTGVELIEAIYYAHFPNPVKLTQALEDYRSLQVTGTKDGLWARVVDPVASLVARPYPSGIASVAPPMGVRVEDPLGFTAGNFVLSFSGGEPQVAATKETPDLTVSVAGLTNLVFGSASPSEMEVAGQLSCIDPSNRENLLALADEVFAPLGEAAFLSEF